MRAIIAAMLFTVAMAGQQSSDQRLEQQRYWNRVWLDSLSRQASDVERQAAERRQAEYLRKQYEGRLWDAMAKLQALWNDHQASRTNIKHMEAFDKSVRKLQETEGYRKKD